MAEINLPRGLILDLITPLKKNGEIDGRGLGRHLDRVLPHAQALLLASPFTGEGRNLDSSQREELLEKVLVVVRGRIPVLVWISHETEEKTIDTLLLLEKKVRLRNYPGQVFWVDAPLLYHSNRGLPGFYRELFSGPDRPVLLLNHPDLIRSLANPLKRNNIRTSVLKDLSGIPAVNGLIFHGSLDRANNYQKAVRTRNDFRIYDGDESRFLSYPSLSGVVSAGANLSPKAWSKITTSSIGRDEGEDTYPDHQYQIWEAGSYLRNLMTLYQTMAPPVLKTVLSEMGVIESPTCTYEFEALGDAVTALRSLIEGFGDDKP